jgi:hypothetical protein
MPGNLPEGLVTLVLGVLILLFAVIKALSDNYVHWPAYIGIVLAAGVAYGSWLVFQDSGESLPRMAGATPGTSGSAAATTPPATPPAEDDAGA